MIISTGPAGDGLESSPEWEAVSEMRELVFEARFHGKRLDQSIAELVPEFSRSYLQQLIEQGAVTLNGQNVLKSSGRVKAGDFGTVELRPTPQSQAFKPETMPLNRVYQDEHLLILNKPAGLVVHPAPGHWSGTLLNGLLASDTQCLSLPRAGIVHRLDKNTSGLMVVARTRPVMDALVRAIAARTVGRQYLALAHRPWLGQSRREIHGPIGRDPATRLKMAVVDLDRHPGKPARTDVDLLMNATHGCLLQCTLHTGRTHQIRVHLASIGHPLVADDAYGGFAAATLERQALHAFRLSLDHPVTGKRLVFTADPPPDFAEALKQWGLSYNLTSSN